MRYVFLLALLIGCGSDDGSGGGPKEELNMPVTTEDTTCSTYSKLVGSWVSSSSETVTITADCNFASDLCETTGTVSTTTGTSGAVTITINQDPRFSSCLSKGKHSCTYATNADVDRLTFTCPGLSESYDKKI